MAMTLESTIIEVRQDAVADIRKGCDFFPGPSWLEMLPDADALQTRKFQRWLPVPERVEIDS